MAYDPEVASRFPLHHYDPKAPINWTLSPALRTFLVLLGISILLANLVIFRLAVLLNGRQRQRPGTSSFGLRPRPKPSSRHPTHLLVVLGSGGHTAEMLNMLQRLLSPLPDQFTHRTYLVSSGDSFSASKAVEFEDQLAAAAMAAQQQQVLGREQPGGGGAGGAKDTKDQGGDFGERDRPGYDVVTVRRARKIHQSILTTPWTATLCLWDCLEVLRQRHHPQQPVPTTTTQTASIGYPDLILTNGPGTGVCVIFAALILLFCGIHGPEKRKKKKETLKVRDSDSDSINDDEKLWPGRGQMRTVFIESWARVKTLSLSGKIVLPLVDRFLVQWPALQGYGGKAEFVGALVA